MQKEIHVIIVEDDPFARDFMSMLLRRDWRTRVVGEYGSDCAIELHHALRQAARRVDVLLVDTEVPTDEHWPMKVAQITRTLERPPALLYTCTSPLQRTLEHVVETSGGGYISKREILYGLASAVTMAARGHFVMTPGVQMIAGKVRLPERAVVMDGMIPVAQFTPRETDIARMGLLCNLEQRDIADDLVVSTDFVAEVTGKVYEKLGLRDILSGEKPPEDYLQDEALLARFHTLMDQYLETPGKKGRKAPWMSTLAFHLLTVAEIETIHS
jgi:DNA-binding NarL/FixJ family response regulator